MNNAPTQRTDDSSIIGKEVQSFGFAFKGLQQVVRHERHLQFHLIMAMAVVLAGWFFHLSLVEWCLVVLAIGLVISAEMLNTAIEHLTDMVSPQFHPVAGMVKDIAAGAVLVASMTSAVIGLIVFLPKLMAWLG